MLADRFDAFTRALAVRTSRRHALAFPLLGLTHADDASAGRKCKPACGECQACKKGRCKKTKSGKKKCKNGTCQATVDGVGCSLGSCLGGKCVAPSPLPLPSVPPPGCAAGGFRCPTNGVGYPEKCCTTWCCTGRCYDARGFGGSEFDCAGVF